jgi:hypothetical protein
MHVQLLRAYVGKYVPILKSQMVDCDEDKCALAKRLYGRIGYQPIYVQLATAGPSLVCQISPPVG